MPIVLERARVTLLSSVAPIRSRSADAGVSNAAGERSTAPERRALSVSEVRAGTNAAPHTSHTKEPRTAARLARMRTLLRSRTSALAASEQATQRRHCAGPSNAVPQVGQREWVSDMILP